ncbi:MAG: RibD family protein, partial [Pseudomonadota bacterium]|nr:RibD family protein [Pseudomonadota bacterium]
AKLAMSLDGKIAGKEGQRLAITGVDVKQYTYQRRKQSDAILTTAKTIQRDNPRLDVRLAGALECKPLYIIDRELSLSLDLAIWANSQPITIFYADTIADERVAAYTIPNVHCVPIPAEADRLDLIAILTKIGVDGIHDLWVEAGGILLQAMLSADLVDSLVFYVAPTWCGIEAQNAFEGQSFTFEQFLGKSWAQIGDDMVCEMSRNVKTVIV